MFLNLQIFLCRHQAGNENLKTRARLAVNETKWCVLRWPTPSMAQQAKMSTEKFEDFYFDACCMDYVRMQNAMDGLVKRMTEADQVSISGPGTDLRFSIKESRRLVAVALTIFPTGRFFLPGQRQCAGSCHLQC